MAWGHTIHVRSSDYSGLSSPFMTCHDVSTDNQ